MRLFLLLCLALPLFCGCRYANARLRDGADCIGASVTTGRGFMVDAQATWLARFGFGRIKGERHAFYYGQPLSMPTKSGVLGLGPLSLESTENADYGFYWLGAAGLPFALLAEGNKTTLKFSMPEPGEGREYYGNHFLDAGFSLHLFYAGVEFRVKLFEILDFLLGFTTLDISSDDGRANPEHPPPPKEKPPGAQPQPPGP